MNGAAFRRNSPLRCSAITLALIANQSPPAHPPPAEEMEDVPRAFSAQEPPFSAMLASPGPGPGSRRASSQVKMAIPLGTYDPATLHALSGYSLAASDTAPSSSGGGSHLRGAGLLSPQRGRGQQPQQGALQPSGSAIDYLPAGGTV